MPNWCYNVIEIIGEDVPIIHEKLKKDNLGLHGIVPESPDPKDWYNYNIKMLGTKWNVEYWDLNVEEYADNNLTLSFNTAWSPPDKWLDALLLMFPNIKVEMYSYESGVGFGFVYTNEIQEEFSLYERSPLLEKHFSRFNEDTGYFTNEIEFYLDELDDDKLSNEITLNNFIYLHNKFNGE